MKGEYISIETLRIMQELEKENKKLQEENIKLKELCDKYEEEHNTVFQIWLKAKKEGNNE